MTEPKSAPNGERALATAAAPVFQYTPLAQRALIREDVPGFLQHALGTDADGVPVIRRYYESDRRGYEVMTALARNIVALRSENIVALHDGEAFVRRTSSGEIRRVTTKVQVSLAAGDLYQMTRSKKDGSRWTKEIATPGVATLTLAGLRKLNDVAGLQVGMTPTVCVNGVERSNPYVERGADIDGCLGDVRRVVVCCVAAGLSAIGAPVVVRYVLEYEPANELRGALLKRCRYLSGSDEARDTFLVPSESVPARLAALNQKNEIWKAFPAYQGLSILVNLNSKPVLEMLEDHHVIISQAERRAQSFAARNAMKAHPALSIAKVSINQETGVGYVQVTGWTGEAAVMADARKVLERAIQTGGVDALMHESEAVQVVEIAGTYEPDDDAADTDTERLPAEDDEAGEDDEHAAADVEARNALIERIESALLTLPPGEVEAIRSRGYKPSENTLEQLTAVDAELRARAMARAQAQKRSDAVRGAK